MGFGGLWCAEFFSDETATCDCVTTRLPHHPITTAHLSFDERIVICPCPLNATRAKKRSTVWSTCINYHLGAKRYRSDLRSCEPNNAIRMARLHCRSLRLMRVRFSADTLPKTQLLSYRGIVSVLKCMKGDYVGHNQLETTRQSSSFAVIR